MSELPFEVWNVNGSRRILVARFHRREDAALYIRRFGTRDHLKVIANGETQPPAETEPPPPFRRRISDVVAATPHPDEFIADQVGAGRSRRLPDE